MDLYSGGSGDGFVKTTCEGCRPVLLDLVEALTPPKVARKSVYHHRLPRDLPSANLRNHLCSSKTCTDHS